MVLACAIAVMATAKLQAKGGVPSREFAFEAVVAVAEAQVAIPYEDQTIDVPCELVGLDYDSWRLISFRPEKTLWRDSDQPFQVETVHRGYLYNQRVQLHEVCRHQVRPLAYTSENYEYRGWLGNYRFPGTLGHSGWKLLGKFTDPATGTQEEYVRELASFLGASYFRVLGSEHNYGSSLRGLAVDIALPTREEFPRFTQFWIREPKAKDQTFKCWALLESPRVVGAYEFEITPAKETILDVRSRVWIRGEVKKLGIAPITSMWMWGSGVEPPHGDKRPEVHDADGLIVVSDQEILWRPLSRPKVPIVNHYAVSELKGFGLLQRQRTSDDYGDSEAQYHRRPSIYIEPKKAWPAGGVELLRLPAHHEGIDNIGAFYVMADAPQVGDVIDFDYRIHVCDDVFKTIKSQFSDPQLRFNKSEIKRLDDRQWRLKATCEIPRELRSQVKRVASFSLDCWSDHGEVISRDVKAFDDRLSFELVLDVPADSPADVIVKIIADGSALSESWCYRCEP